MRSPCLLHGIIAGILRDSEKKLIGAGKGPKISKFVGLQSHVNAKIGLP